MQRPLLASEVMVEDRAPLEPWRRLGRRCQAIMGAGWLGVGVSVWAGVGLPRDAASVAFSAGAAALLVAALPFSYAVRAAFGAVLGTALMVLGLGGAGPLAGLAIEEGGLREVARAIAGTTLPAALFLMAWYPTFRGARYVLAAALLLALPLLGLEGAIALDSTLPWTLRVTAGTVAVVLLACPAALAGDGSLSTWAPWGWLLLGALAGETAVRELVPGARTASGWLTHPATGLGFLAATTLASLGIGQLLATVMGPPARAELRQKVRPGGERRLNDPGA